MNILTTSVLHDLGKGLNSPLRGEDQAAIGGAEVFTNHFRLEYGLDLCQSVGLEPVLEDWHEARVERDSILPL